MTTVHTSGQPFRFSREQYYRLGKLNFFQGRRVERIHGEIVEMSPINWNHSLAVGLILDALQIIFHTNYWVHSQNPICLADSDPEPDVAVYPGKRRDYTSHPSYAVLIVEVADTSLSYDTTTKAELYATAGVPEYWVLDLEHRQLLVFRDPEPLPAGLGATAYRTRSALGEFESVSPLAVPSASVMVRELLP